MSREDVPQLTLRGYGFQQRARWFSKVLKEVLRHQSVSLPYGYGRPKSDSILMHCSVIAIPWPADRVELVDKWLLSFGPDTFKRQSKLLDAIPFASRNDSFPQVWV